VGRGSAWFLRADEGDLVLRHYLRGGWAAKLSHRHYVYTGASKTRPFREFSVLAKLLQLGLPVPSPVAAMIKTRYPLYSGAILMEMIPSVGTLADFIMADRAGAGIEEAPWRQIGLCIRRFHDAGVWHADLNARNILVNADNDVYLLDFDRARFSPGVAVRGENNLARLKRSVNKLCPPKKHGSLELAWKRLETAYHE
jgi:3-deoxy-D-manno-octulosonic acid kinase